MTTATALASEAVDDTFQAADPAPLPTILIVDDSPVDRRLAGSIVEKQLGLKVRYARHGAAALAALQESLPGAILADLLMPEMDGLELVEAVRRTYPLVPIVLMTAHGSEDIATQALKAGAASYVPKKNLHRSLAPTLEQVLMAARTGRRMHCLLKCATEVEFRFSLDNDATLVPTLVMHFQEYLHLLHQCDQTEQTQLGIALEEAILNGIYHGNLALGADLREEDDMAYYRLAAVRRQEPPYRERRLTVDLKLTRELAEVTVRDEGRGFDVAGWLAGKDRLSLSPTLGRGLMLIYNFMDEVRHNAEGNEITMVKRHQPRQEVSP